MSAVRERRPLGMATGFRSRYPVAMESPHDLPRFLRDPGQQQPDLFASLSSVSEPSEPLYAGIVFNRPLDHSYTYSIPAHLRQAIAVGKRVLAPFGRGDKGTIGFCVELSSAPPSRPVKELIQVIDDQRLLTPDLMQLTRWMADYYLCGWGQVLQIAVPAGAKKQAGTREAVYLLPVPEREIPHPPPDLTARQRLVLQCLRDAGRPVEPKELATEARCSPATVSALIEKKYVRRTSRRVETGRTETASPTNVHERFTLNADQQDVWSAISAALHSGGFHPFLLLGVTGSGKTEIYLRAIEEVVGQGKQAIVLVPEISLTPQTIERFQGRFGQIAILHSHLGEAERGAHWRRVAAGQVRIVVGARSAIFAPTGNLGLIVVDEEHEATYKQESAPRYNARDVAVMRARLQNIPILLGSATPSLESWQNADRGHYKLLQLPRRVEDRPLPQVALIDLRHDRAAPGFARPLSATLERAMREALRAGGQVILLLNRRGFSTYVHCPGCGHVILCRFCDLALTHHRERDILQCHYCGYEQTPDQECPQCHQRIVRYQGIGTEKLEAEVVERFKGFVVRRMDSDTMRRPGSHERVLSAFKQGLIHILLGTQMIAKGLDFPNVTLVGVVNADVALHVPDFRAPERTFQLLAQVAGRAGRGSAGGRVLIQTFNPDHQAIALAANHDYAAFAARELATRRAHSYPPFERLARVIVRGRKQEAALEFVERLAGAFHLAVTRLHTDSPATPPVRILGPAEAPVFRLKGQSRYHIQVMCSSSQALHQVLRNAMASVRPPSGVEFVVDVDPLNML